MNLRTEERRRSASKICIVVPALRSYCLNGVTKKSAAGQVISGEFFLFKLYDKATGTYIETVTLGKPAAMNLIELSGCDVPPSFNPFISEPAVRKESQEKDEKAAFISEAETEKEKRTEWSPCAKQLYDAMSLLAAAWEVTDGILLKLMEEVAEDPKTYPGNKIKAFNTILGKDKKQRKLKGIVADLRKDNPDLRYFNFNLLEDYLKKKEIESNF